MKLEGVFQIVDGQSDITLTREDLDFEISVSMDKEEEFAIGASNEMLLRRGFVEIGTSSYMNGFITLDSRTAHYYKGTLQFGRFILKDIVVVQYPSCYGTRGLIVPQTLFTDIRLNLRENRATLIYEGSEEEFAHRIQTINQRATEKIGYDPLKELSRPMPSHHVWDDEPDVKTSNRDFVFGKANAQGMAHRSFII